MSEFYSDLNLKLDFSRKYYRDLFLDLENIKNQIMAEKFDLSKRMNISWNIENGNGNVEYEFKKMPKKVPENLLISFSNKSVENFMKRKEILAFTKIVVPAGQHVAPHYDNSYWGPEFFRAHIPLMDTTAYFIYGDEKIIWQKGKLYFFDVRRVFHGANNYSDKDFEFVAIDIRIENA